jgi:autotransporter translocation and assembly factor TamB
VGVIKATPVITSLLEDRMSLKSFELENAIFPREFLPVLLQNRGGRGFGVQRILAKGLKLDIPELNMPVLDVDASLSSDGALQSVALFDAERKLSVKLQPQGGRAAIEISSNTFPLPLGMDLAFSEFLAKGTVTRNELALSDAEFRAFGGRLLGNARLRWSDGWSLEGELAVRQMDAEKIAAPLLAGGTLEGKAVYSMKALLPERLLLNLRLDGNFTIQKGSITNVDMTRLLQGSGSGGGTTLFSEMSGGVSVDPTRLVVRQIRMAAGLLNAAGQVEMDPQKNLSGRVQVDLRAQSVQARATLTLAGTLQNPQFRRSN